MHSPRKMVSPLSIYQDTNIQPKTSLDPLKQFQEPLSAKRLAQASPAGSRDRRKRVFQADRLFTVDAPTPSLLPNPPSSNALPEKPLPAKAHPVKTRPEKARPAKARPSALCTPYDTDGAIEYLLGNTMDACYRETSDLREVVEFANLERYFGA